MVLNDRVTNDDANQSPALATQLLMLWHFSPNESKQKIFFSVKKVSLGPPTMLVTNRPPGNGRKLDSSRESLTTSRPLVPDPAPRDTIPIQPGIAP